MSTKIPVPHPEFSSLLSIDKIPAGGLIKKLEATPLERKSLLKRFDLLDLSHLEAELTVEFARAGRAVKVTGYLIADVVQKCGVTTEPVPDHLEHGIEILYTKDVEDLAPQAFVEPTDIDVEPIENGILDLGELVSQNLAVALNPYPRKPGAVFETKNAEEVVVPLTSMAKLLELTKKAKDKS